LFGSFDVFPPQEARLMKQLGHLKHDHPNGKQTGPNTEIGKQRVARNALQHGLSADRLVLPWESADDWERHRQGMLETLGPGNAFELELAERVALCLWRLRRVARYETAITLVGQEDAEDEKVSASLAQVFDATDTQADKRLVAEFDRELDTVRQGKERTGQVLDLLGRLAELADQAPIDGRQAYHLLACSNRAQGNLPDAKAGIHVFLDERGIELGSAEKVTCWTRWTASLLREALAFLNPRVSLEEVVKGIGNECRARLKRLARREKRAAAMSKIFAERAQQRAERQRERLRLPDKAALEKVMRFEAHLGRQFVQALHTLERWQAARAGQRVSAPAALVVS
jgi:hypothetical protein